MTISSLLTLMGIWLAALVSPGPDIVQVIRVAPRSTRAGLLCAVGVFSGTVFWIVASLAGLSALITARPGVLSILQLLGGLFLLYMGVSSLRSGLAARRAPAREVDTEDYAEQARAAGDADVEDMTNWRAFKLGLVTNLSNPKALVFFGAVFAQFIRPDMSVGWTTAVALILAAMSFVWFSSFALLVRAAARWTARYSAGIDIVSGLVFGLLGVVMAGEGATALLKSQ